MDPRHKIFAISLGLFLLIALFIPASGKAQGIIYGDEIQEGQVIDNNLLLNGTDVTINGIVNGDVLAFGRTITINGQVNGTLLAVAETITLNGEVTGNQLAGAIRVELGPESKVVRDLYAIGAGFMLPEGSMIERDLYLLSLEAQLAGQVERDIHAIIGPVQIARLIFGPLQDRIAVIGSVETRLVADVSTPRLAGIGLGTFARATGWLTDEAAAAQQAAQLDTERLQKWGVGLIRNLVALLVIGLLGVWLLPKPIISASERIRQSPWRMAFVGLAFYLGGWFFATLILILVLMLALFFYSVSLPNLGFLLGSLGTLGVGLGVAVFWLAIAYLSKIIFAFLVGRLLLQRFGPRYAQSKFWPLLLGVVLYALAASIPYLGWVVATVVTFLGLGALWGIAFPSLSLMQASVNQSALPQADAPVETE